MQGSDDVCVAKESVATTMNIASIECPIGKAYIQGSDANCSLDRNTVTLGDSSASAEENLSIGSVVGFVDIAHLGDGSDIVSFSLSDDEFFEVNASGVIKLKKALDYETTDEYNLTVVVTNGAGMSTRVKLDIEVLDVDDELYILSATYDDNDTVSVADDRLILNYSKAIDEQSISVYIEDNFIIHDTGTIDPLSTAEYNATANFQHTIYLGENSTLLANIPDINISLAPGEIVDLQGSADTSIQTPVQMIVKATVKKTGQTKSYDEDGTEVTDDSIKDDGHYQSGIAPRYSRDDSTEIVTDHITGLMWADDASVSSVTKQWLTDENYATCSNDTSDPACYDTSSDSADPDDDTATEYCDALTLGGFNDWRLPTSVELESIVDHGRVSPSIDTAYFKHTSSNSYWSSTTYEGSKYYAWRVYFGSGSAYDYYKDYSFYVRCVRAGQ